MEPNLYSTTLIGCEMLQSQGMKLETKCKDYKDAKLRTIGYKMYMGCEIERNKNTDKDVMYQNFGQNPQILDQITKDIKNLAKIKDEKQVKFAQYMIQNFHVYLHPNALANILLQMNLEFECQSPLTLIKQNAENNLEDQCYPFGEVPELHTLSFECEVIRMGKQIELQQKNFNQQEIMQEVYQKLSGGKSLDVSWTLVDIDKFLKGNDHYKHIKELQ